MKPSFMDYMPFVSAAVGVAAFLAGMVGRLNAKRNKRMEAIEEQVKHIPLIQAELKALKEQHSEEKADTRSKLDKILDIIITRPRS